MKCSQWVPEGACPSGHHKAATVKHLDNSRFFLAELVHRNTLTGVSLHAESIVLEWPASSSSSTCSHQMFLLDAHNWNTPGKQISCEFVLPCLTTKHLSYRPYGDWRFFNSSFPQIDFLKIWCRSRQSDVHVHDETSSSGCWKQQVCQFGFRPVAQIQDHHLIQILDHQRCKGKRSSELIWNLNNDVRKDHDCEDLWKCGNHKRAAAAAELWGLLLITWTNKRLYGGSFCGLTKQKHFRSIILGRTTLNGMNCVVIVKNVKYRSAGITGVK